MEKLKVNKYLSESEDLKSLIKKNNLIYLIAGCGLGKSYLTNNYLMKEYKTITINFLNSVNISAYKDTYVSGNDGKVNYYKGDKSIAINVAQIGNIKLDTLLLNIDLVVIDEVHNHHLVDYRGDSTGEELEKFIIKCKLLGVKVLIITGTPMLGKHLDIENIGFLKVEVSKEVYDESDNYYFPFLSGFAPNNCGKYIANRVNEGKQILLLTNLYTERIESTLREYNISYCKVFSDDKENNGSATNYILNKHLLPDDCDVVICTAVLSEGVDLNEYAEKAEHKGERNVDIEIITFAEDIKTPQQAIQLAGRLRNQPKNLTIGIKYRKDNRIIEPTIRKGFSKTIKSKTIKDGDISKGLLSTLDNWVSYLERYANKGHVKVTLNEYNEKSIKSYSEKIDINLEEIYNNVLMDIKKVDKHYRELEKPFTTYYKVKKGEVDKVEIKEVEGKDYKVIYANNNIVNIKNLLKAMNYGLDFTKLGRDRENAIFRAMNTAWYFSIALNSDKALKEDYFNGLINFSSAVFKEKITKLLGDNLTYTKDGIDIKPTSKVLCKYIYNPISILENFPRTIWHLMLADNPEYLYKISNPFANKVNLIDDIDINDVFIDEYDKFIAKIGLVNKKADISIKRSKGGKATKTITLINDSIGFSMVFNSSKDCDNYVVASLGFTKREKERLRNSEVKGYKRA